MVTTNSLADATPFEILLYDCRKEYDQVQRELKEIDMLIQQSTGEVEKLARRHAQATNNLRHVQANIDTVPREDIRDGYDMVQDAQQRLFTMRGQLEKLQSDQKNMERYIALLRRFLDVTDGPITTVGEGGTAGAAGEEEKPIIVRVVEAQEAERRRLSRAMHDGPAQSMTNFILQAEICQRLYESDPEQSRDELIGLKTAATGTFQRIRDFIFELRPMMLDDLGLIPTIRRYTELFSNKHNVPIEVTIVGKDIRIEPYLEVTAFRIVQELLNNIRDHAQASQVRVNVELGEQELLIAVDDNGVGFNVEDALVTARQRHTVGFSTMSERVDMLNGSLDIDSKLGQGTQIKVAFPVSV